MLLGLGLSQAELQRAEDLVKQGFRLADQVFSNGDFYPRNLLRVQQRIVLIDWAYWAGNRACFIDYLPNVIAFAFIHMWANRAWQTSFLRNVVNTFGIKTDDLRKAVIIKSFEQTSFWQAAGRPDLLPNQFEHLRMALENRLPL